MIRIKDLDKLKDNIILEGYTPSSLSQKLSKKKNRKYLSAVFKNRTIGPGKAAKICEVLGISFETHFEIVREGTKCLTGGEKEEL